ncbi:MAG TPA: hypothetical protein VMT89_04540 [Candidatus Acidoferrales bacterium]|nr:hypothetical protein [Candidatus Acidoferrales bacterium]
MIGFRDTLQAGAHTVRLDSEGDVFIVPFDESACIWDPAPELLGALTANPLRRARFARISREEAKASSPGTQAGEAGAEPAVSPKQSEEPSADGEKTP